MDPTQHRLKATAVVWMWNILWKVHVLGACIHVVGAILKVSGNFRRWEMIIERNGSLGTDPQGYLVLAPRVPLSVQCLSAMSWRIFSVICPCQEGGTMCWTLWNCDPKWMSPSLSCSPRSFGHGCGKMTNTENWYQKWGCCCCRSGLRMFGGVG